MANSDSILLLGTPSLRAYNAPVESFDSTTADICQRLSETLTDTPHGAAVAAPQIGINQRVFVWNDQAAKTHRTVINPRILSWSEEEWSYKEGCLSIPERWWYLRRPRYIEVSWYDETGKSCVGEWSDFEARLFQHEVDHLKGKLLLDILTPGELKRARKALAKEGLSDTAT